MVFKFVSLEEAPHFRSAFILVSLFLFDWICIVIMIPFQNKFSELYIIIYVIILPMQIVYT